MINQNGKMSVRSRVLVYLCLLLGSALVLLFFAGASPLYPTNPWVDANCFHTVARNIAHGKVLYRDIIEQKGPLLYFLHVPAVLLSPHSFLGVYVLEVLALWLMLCASWKTISLFVHETWWPLLLAVAVWLASSLAFAWGDSAEEICTPLLAWSLYDGLRCLSDPERRMSCACLLRNGFFAGCVLCIKYSLLGLHFIWMASIAIDSVVRERRLMPALRMCLIFLAGMALPVLPCLLYFAANGALGDLWRVYIVQNTQDYAQEGILLLNGFFGLFGGSIRNPLMGLGALGGTLYLLLEHRDGKQIPRKLFLAIALVFTFFVSYSGGRFNGYYYYIAACFVPLGCVPLALAAQKLTARGRVLSRIVSIGCVLALCCMGAVTNRNLPMLGYPREELAQKRFAQLMHEREGTSLLNFGFLDGGFYLASEIEPSNPWFCKLLANPHACFAEQSSIIERGSVDFVVTRGHRLEEYDLDASAYQLIAQQTEEFNYKDRGLTYFLYEKM